MDKEIEKRIEELEARVAEMQKHIDQLSRNMANTPSRFEFDSLMRQQQSRGSIIDGLFG